MQVLENNLMVHFVLINVLLNSLSQRQLNLDVIKCLSHKFKWSFSWLFTLAILHLKLLIVDCAFTWLIKLLDLSNIINVINVV